MTEITKNNLFISNIQNSEIPDAYREINLENFIEEIDESSVDEIFIKDILGNINDHQIIDFLSTIEEKMKINAIIHIQDIDIEQFCLYISNQILPIKMKNLLYNNRNNVWYMQQIVDSIRTIKNLKILQLHYINGYEFYVRAEKINNE